MIGLRKGSGNFEEEEWDFGFIIKERRTKTIVITVYNNIRVKVLKKLKERLDKEMEEKLKKEGNLIII